MLDSDIHTSILDNQHFIYYLALVFLGNPCEFVQELISLLKQLVTLIPQVVQLEVGLLAGGGVVGVGHSQRFLCALK